MAKINSIAFIFLPLLISCSAARQKAEVLKEIEKFDKNLDRIQFDTTTISKLRDSLNNSLFHINRKKWASIERYFIELKAMEDANKMAVTLPVKPKFTTKWKDIPKPPYKQPKLEGPRSLRMEAEFELERQKVRLDSTSVGVANLVEKKKLSLDSIIFLSRLKVEREVDSLHQVQFISEKKIEQKRKVRLAASEIKKAFYKSYRKQRKQVP